MIPFMVICPNRAWILLGGTVFLSYLILKQYVETNTWAENPLVTVAVCLPFYGLLLYDYANSRSLL
jgi:hypothetical protein